MYTDVRNPAMTPLHRKDVGLQSMVLLKNSNGILPLKSSIKIAVVGPQAATRRGLLSDYASEQPCFDTSGDGGNCILTIADEIRVRNDKGAHA